MNEEQIISAIRQRFNASKQRDRGFYDDVVFLSLNGKLLAFKADMFVSSTDMLPGMSLRQAARKAVISSLSDMAAKGVRAEYFVSSLGIPRRISNRKSIIQIIEGLNQASKEFNVRLVGGDVNESKELVMDIIVAGTADKSPPRSGAKENDLVIATGAFGYTGLGLAHLLKGLRLPSELKRDCLQSVYEPKPNFELTISIVSTGIVNASMDSSDGLALTLYEISEQSGLAIKVNELPADEKLLGIDERYLSKKTLYEAILYGGEEFHTVMTIPESEYEKVQNIARSRGGRIFKVGKVVKGAGVHITYDGGKSWRKLSRRGWVHLEK